MKKSSRINRVLKNLTRPKAYLHAAARLSSPLLSVFESKPVESEISNELFPVFIIGAPRTGSTILYQLLTSSLDCLYIDNLVYSFFRNFQFGFWLSRKVYGENSHQSFESEYGNTNSLHAPSECGAFWYRWFPRSHDFVQSNDISHQEQTELRHNVVSVMKRYQKCIIFKNLNAGQRLNVLKNVFPNAKFIFIQRDPFFTIQSLLQAREHLGIPDNKWWSVRPKNFEDLSLKRLVEKIVGQVYCIEKQIVDDLPELIPSNVFNVKYSTIADQFHKMIDQIEIPVRQKTDVTKFSFKNKVSLSEQRKNEVLAVMRDFDWAKLGYEKIYRG